MRVQIEHPTTGERFEVALSDYRRAKAYLDPKSGELVTYERAGFGVTAQADGAPYEPPARPEARPESRPNAAPSKED